MSSSNRNVSKSSGKRTNSYEGSKSNNNFNNKYSSTVRGDKNRLLYPTSDFLEWRTETTITLVQKWGLLGSVLETCAIPTPELDITAMDEIDEDLVAACIPEPETQPQTPEEVASERVRVDLLSTKIKKDLVTSINSENMKMYAKSKAAISADCGKIYMDIWRSLSVESQELVRREIGTLSISPKSNELVMLCHALKTTHLDGRLGVESIDRLGIMEMFTHFKQRDNEYVGEYYRRFNRMIQTYEEIVGELPDEALQAARFLKGLNATYNDLNVALQNNHNMRVKDYPMTMDEAYDTVKDYRTVPRGQVSVKEIAYAIESNIAKQSHQKQQHRQHKQPHQSRAQQQQFQQQSPQQSQHQPQQQQINRKTLKGNANKKPSNKPDCCRICLSTDHRFMDQCPERDTFLKAARECSGRETMRMTTAVDDADTDEEAEALYMVTDNCVCSKRSVSNPAVRNLPKFGCLTGDSNPLINLDVNHASSITDAPDDSITDSTLSSTECVAATSVKQHSGIPVILDSAATIHVFRDDDLLTNLHKIDKTVSVSGIGGAIQADTVGTLEPFGEVYYHPDVSANVLSQGLLEFNQLLVTYEPGECYNVFSNDGQHFRFDKTPRGRGGALYICNFERNQQALVTTVAANEAAYTKREVHQAQEARNLQAKLGYPTISTLSHMLSNANVISASVTPQDVGRSVAIYGKSLPELKGKTTDRKTHMIRDVESFHTIQIHQTMYGDLMFCNRIPFLITVTSPLGLTSLLNMKAKDAKVICDSLNVIVKSYELRGYFIDVLHTDGDGAFALAADALKSTSNTKHNVAGPGKHVPVIERAIRYTKETARSILASLPYNLPGFLLPYLFKHAVHCQNVRPSNLRVDSLSPREAFTGIKTDLKREFRIAFGSYAQVFIPRDIKNTMEPRTEGAIALGSTGNMQGSVHFFLLGSSKIVSRDQFHELPITTDVVRHMNKFGIVVTAADLKVTRGLAELPVPDDAYLNTSSFKPRLPRTVQHKVVVAPREAACPPAVPPDPPAELPKDFVPVLPVVTSSAAPITDAHTNLGENSLVTLGTVNRPTIDPSRLSFRQGIKIYGSPAIEAVRKEMAQMIAKKVFEPVFRDSVPKYTTNILYTSMFLKAKLFPNGLFEKLKARWIAGGDMQVINDSTTTASPTLDLTSFFIILCLAIKEDMIIMTADVGGAFLNAKRPSNAPVYVVIAAFIAKILIELKPEWKQFVHPVNGTITALLKQALYGCKDSPALWFNTLMDFLKGLGFEQHALDPCVLMHKTRKMYVCVYVDDLLILSKSADDANWLLDALKDEYKEITTKEGDEQNYLGMMLSVNRKEKNITMSMPKHIMEILESTGTTKTSTMPHNNDLFDVVDDGLLSEDEKDKFRSVVASLLYLGKRARPDILLVVQFLSTRVSGPFNSDRKKLDKLLKYLNGTKDDVLVLGASLDERIRIMAYVDSSFGSHICGKGQTGIFVTLGQGPIFVKSTKQRLVGKSSTEAELIGVSDALSQIIWIRDFIIRLGYPDVPPAIIFQDNTSTITIIRSGEASGTFTKHINVRYGFIRDRIDLNEIVIIYLSTLLMIADLLTKPLPIGLFGELKMKILGMIKLMDYNV